MRVFFCLLAALLAAFVHAQSAGDVGAEPGLNWAVNAEAAWEDNVFRAADALASSDFYYGLRPELAWYGFSGANQFDVAATGNFRRYSDEDVLDFDAWGLSAHALLDHTARLNTDYTLAYDQGAQPPGENGQLGFPGRAPNEFESWSAGWTVTYGAAQAAGQLVGTLRYSEQEFTNNNQGFRDTNNTQATGIFYYRIAPRTRLLFQIDYTDFDFQQTDAFGSNQSGEEFRYLGGVTWEATAKTTGEFKIGYRDRTFEDDRFGEATGLALSLDMTWSPDELTSVRIGAREENQDAALQGVGGIVRTGADISYRRAITARTSLVADVAYDELSFGGEFGREDDTWNLGAGFEYSLLPRLTVGLQYRYENRASSAELFDYSANSVLLTFTLTPPR